MTIRERHDPLTATEESRERHRTRYYRAIELGRDFGEIGGIWWDVACGTGYGTIMMPGRVVVGIDRDVATIRAAELLYPNAVFRSADVSQAAWQLAAREHPPDVILSVETLEHLDRYEQDAFICGCAVALDGGTLVLACPIGDARPPANPWHKHEPTENELRRLLLGHFSEILHFEAEAYDSTSGPAVQAYVVAR